VKSLRTSVQLKEACARFRGEELFLVGVHLSPYVGEPVRHEPERTRKLLLHRRELDRLRGKIRSGASR
jgi:SsrA-binding protein